MIEVRVDSRLRLRREQLNPDLERDVKAICEHDNPAFGKMKALGYKYTAEPRRYITWRETERELSIPRGRLRQLREVFARHGLEHNEHDVRTRGCGAGKRSGDGWGLEPVRLFNVHNLALWPNQCEIVKVIGEREQCLIRSPTGSGKSTAILAAIAELQVWSIVILWETALLKQWQARAELELGIAVEDQGLIWQGECRLAPLTFAMQQTMHNWAEPQWSKVHGVFGLLALDEVQRYAADTYTEVCDRFDSVYRVGVSDDPSRADKKDFLIADQLGEVVLEIKKADLIKSGHVVDVGVRVVPTTFAAPWYTSKRRPKGPDVNKLLVEMAVDSERNDLALQIVQQCVEREQFPILIFCRHVDHAKRLCKMLECAGVTVGLMLGGAKSNELEFERTKRGMIDGSVQVGVGTLQKMAVGMDVPSACVGVFMVPIKNNQMFQQMKGRICRASSGKTGATAYVLWDRAVQGKLYLNQIRKWNPGSIVWDDIEQCWKNTEVYLGMRRKRGEATNQDQEFGDIFIGVQR